MGCDIHPHIEYRKHDQWWHYCTPWILRNYLFFGLIAAVRVKDVQMVATKGFPIKDATYETKAAFGMTVTSATCEWGGCGSLITPERAAEKGYQYLEEGLMEHPDHHTPSWLTTEELREVIRAYTVYPVRDSPYRARSLKVKQQIPDEIAAAYQAMKTLGESRLVFWFDN